MRSIHSVRVTAVAVVCVLGVLLVLLTGCGSSGSGGVSASPLPAPTLATAEYAKVQTCAACAGGMAPMVEGTAVTADGVQVLNVGVKGGYYSPNVFKVSAGTPVTMVFTGKAEGCLAQPQIDALDKGTDFTSGSATLRLGKLKAGTYVFTCGMGMEGGKIVVR